VPYKYIVGIVFIFGLFMELLDMTAVNVALPTLAREFSAGPTTVVWVVTGYLLSLAVFIPISGWVGDRFGTKRTFMFALTVFTTSSLLCALSWSIESLVAFRVLQGVGGGMLTPVGTAMMFRAFPPAERAAASAVLAIPAVVAPACGPVLGGYLVEYHSWHWIFLINIPIGVIGLIVAGIFLREERQPSPGKLDVPGFVLSGSGLALIMYSLAEAGTRGFGDSRVLATGISGLVLIAVFCAVELRTAEPMIDVKLLLGNKLFRAATLVQFMSFIGFAGALFLLPLLMQAEMGLTPLQSGLNTFPQALGVVIMAQPVSRIYKRVGPQRLMMFGMVGSTLITLAFLSIDLQTSQWWIRGIMFVRGLMFGCLMVPMQTATFATVKPEDMGRASAVFSSFRQVAAGFGTALLATVLSNRLIHYDAVLFNPLTRDGALLAFHDAFLAAAVLSALGIFAVLLIDDKEAAPTMQRGAGPPIVE